MQPEASEEHLDLRRDPTGTQKNEQHDPKDGAWQAAIVTRCLDGDERAFALIADQYGDLLLRTAYLLVKDEEEAKDIVQEALLLAWKNLRSLREPAFLRAWLLKIVVNQAMSFKRQLARKGALLREAFLQQSIDTTIQMADRERGLVEDTLDVAQAIERLPLNQRAVLVLFYYQKMTMPEIAETLGVAENTLRKRLQAALTKVRRVVRMEGSSPGETLLSSNGLHSHIGIHKREA